MRRTQLGLQGDPKTVSTSKTVCSLELTFIVSETTSAFKLRTAAPCCSVSMEFTPVESTVGGAMIGLAAANMLLVHGRVAGISGNKKYPSCTLYCSDVNTCSSPPILLLRSDVLLQTKWNNTNDNKMLKCRNNQRTSKTYCGRWYGMAALVYNWPRQWSRRELEA